MNHIIPAPEIVQINNRIGIEVFIYPDDLKSFDTDFKINLSIQLHTYLDFFIELKSFSTRINTSIQFHNFNKQETLVSTFLNDIIKNNYILIYIKYPHTEVVEKKYMVPDSDIVRIQFFLQSLVPTNDLSGLKQSLLSIPNHFLIPYSKENYFSLLCKIPDDLFKSIRDSQSEMFNFLIEVSLSTIQFKLFHKGIAIGYFQITLQDIDNEVIEDFTELIKVQEIEFFISSPTLLEHYTKTFQLALTDKDIISMKHFFRM